MKKPIVGGFYADPESRVYNGKAYIYVTRSLPYEEQLNLDVVVSEDLEGFDTVTDILDIPTYNGIWGAVWAPSVIEAGGRYYIVFAANDIHENGEAGGLYVGVCDTPDGKFKNVRDDGGPILNTFYNGAQPIDAHFYKDTDGEIYLYYGGWGHLNVCRMAHGMDGIITDTLKEITPANYVEAPFVMRGESKYILMYSSGSWTNGTYCVKTATADTPMGPFLGEDTVLSASELADGPGHNSGFEFGGKTYIAYHRRVIGDKNCHHRVLCIDEMNVCGDRIEKIIMT